MGKKTDSFTANLQTISDQSHTLVADVKAAAILISKYADEFTALEQAHNARSQQIINAHGKDPNKFEPAIENDTEIRKIGLALDKVGPALMQARNDKRAALTKLGTVNAQLKTETAKFTAYITSKEKSINPFKSKNSLPVAKELIKVANDLIAKNQAML